MWSIIYSNVVLFTRMYNNRIGQLTLTLLHHTYIYNINTALINKTTLSVTKIQCLKNLKITRYKI